MKKKTRLGTFLENHRNIWSLLLLLDVVCKLLKFATDLCRIGKNIKCYYVANSLLIKTKRLQIKPQLWQELSVSGQRNRLPLFVSHSLFFHFAGMLLSSLFLFSITLNGPDKLLIPVSLNTFISATEHVEIQKKKKYPKLHVTGKYL